MKFLTCFLLSCSVVYGAVRTTDDAIIVDFDNKTKLTFALHNGWLLGLNQAQVNGYALTAANTALRPLVAQEHGAQREMWPFLKLKSIEEEGDKVLLTVELFGGNKEAFYRAHYVWRGDTKAAQAGELPAEFAELKQQAAEAQAALMAAANKDTAVIAAQAEFEKPAKRKPLSIN